MNYPMLIGLKSDKQFSIPWRGPRKLKKYVVMILLTTLYTWRMTLVILNLSAETKWRCLLVDRLC